MEEHKFSKSFSLIDLLFMATGAMLGWGWVVLSGDWVSQAGFGGTAIAFTIGGILIIFIGLTYAELASSIPKTGGGMVFVLRAFKPKAIGYFAAWSVLFGYVSVITFEAVALPTVIDYILPFEHVGHMWSVGGDDVFFTWVIIGSFGSIILTSLNYFGVTPAKIVQNVLTLGVVAPLLGHASLNWFVNAGGIGIVLGYLVVSISFLKLRKTEPSLERPFSIKRWKVIGLIAVILSILFILLYMPFSPSALVWPMEWFIVIGWYLIGLLFFMMGKEKHINRDYNGGIDSSKEISK